MKASNDIWLGDLAQALKTLGPQDDYTRTVITRLLHFELPLANMATSKHKVPELEGTQRSTDQANAQQRSERPPKDEPLPTPPADKTSEITTVLTPVEIVPVQPLTGWEVIEPLESFAEKHKRPPLPFVPLFDSRWSRELMAALAATRQLIGPIDIMPMVEAIAKGQPIPIISRTPIWSLSRGVQLLIDLSTAMEPFRKDQADFAARLQKVVGPEHVEEVRFYDFPLRGAYMGVDAERGRYRLPDPEVPVIILSDMGIGGPYSRLHRSTTAEWLEFIVILMRRNSRAIALLPYPDKRWPTTLTILIPFVYWDRRTTIGKVRTILKRLDE